jgi:hypothetical protein
MKDPSRQQEDRVAARSGGTRNVMSGAGWMRKHDVRSPGILWEMKRTGKKSITIKLDDLESVRKEAILEGRTALLGFELGGRNYVIVEENDWHGQ